jgi:hypothetical protein
MAKALMAAMVLALAGCAAPVARHEDASQSPPPSADVAQSPSTDHATDPAFASRPADDSGEVEGFHLRISTDKLEYLPGEPIRAEVTLTNVGATRAGVPVPNPPFAQYKIKVLDADNHPVPATPYGREQMNPWKWSFGQATLSPHRSISWTAPLDTLFELRKPGTYRVSAQRVLFHRSGDPGFITVGTQWAPFSISTLASGDESTPIRLELLTKDEYGTGGPVIVTVRLTNSVRTSEAIPVTSPAFLQYRVRVVLPNGAIAPETLYGQQQLHPTIGSSEAVSLAPGASTDWQVNLARLFDMTTDGRYTVEVQRSVFRRDNQGLVRLSASRPLTLTSHAGG